MRISLCVGLVLLGALAIGVGCKDDDSVNVAPTGVRLLAAEVDPLGGGTPAPGLAASSAVSAGAADGGNVLDIGHPSRIEVTIKSSSRVRNLEVQLYIIDRLEFDPAFPSKATQFLIGGASIDLVSKGERPYVIELSVPYTDEDFDATGVPVYSGTPLRPDRDYYLFAQLDPNDHLVETDEEDNRPDAERLATSALVAFLSNEKRDDPNVFLDDVVLDLDLRMVDTTQLTREPPPSDPDFCNAAPGDSDPFEQLVSNFGNTQLGLSAVLSATGAYIAEETPGPIPRVDLQAVFHWEGAGGETWDMPVLIWDSEGGAGEEGAYSKTLSVYDVLPGQPRTIHVDLRLDEDLDPSIAADLLDLQNYIFGTLPVCIDPLFGECGLDVPACASVDTLEQCLATIDLECAYDCFVREAGSGSVEVSVTAWDRHEDGTELPGVELPGFVFDTTGELPELNVTPPPLASAVEEVCSDLAGGNVCPEARASQRYETGFSKDFSDGAVGKLAGARVDFDAMAALDLVGASASANGRAQLTLFGFDFDVLGLTAAGAASPIPTERGSTYFELDLRSDFAFASDRILFSREMSPCRPDGTTNDLDLSWDVFSKRAEQVCKDECADGDSNCEDICEEKVQAYEQSRGVEKTFFISIVPVTARFEAVAGLGFSAGIGLPECTDPTPALFQAHAGPYSEVGTEMSAGVGFPGFGVGAAADVNLLEDTFFARAQVVGLGLDPTPGDSFIFGTLGEDVINTLTGPNGEGYLYANYPCGLKWCGWYPCLKRCQARKNLFRFETFEKRDVLFCDSQYVELGL